MKLFKNKLISNTFILMLSGMATKILGLIIKIIFTRIVGLKTISLYTLVMPTYSLILSIATLAMPTTIAKLISENDDIKILNSATIIIILLNIFIILIMFIISPFIANYLLKEPNSYYLLIAMSFTLPFASLACILKGYFYGKQKMIPHVVSNTIEQIIRIILVITIIPLLIRKSYIHAAVGLILTSTVTEIASVIVFISFLNKKDRIKLSKINYNATYSKTILKQSIPNVGSRIINNICYFLEPVLLTNILFYKGYTTNYIITQYGIYNSYCISTLSIPSFFINALALALIPEISKLNYQKEYSKIKKIMLLSITFTIILGIIFTSIILIFRSDILQFLYNTNEGLNYIKLLALVFPFFYLENLFTSFFSAIGNTKLIFKISIIGSVLKIITTSILSFCSIGIYGLIYSEIINILLIIIIDIYYYRKQLNYS